MGDASYVPKDSLDADTPLAKFNQIQAALFNPSNALGMISCKINSS